MGKAYPRGVFFCQALLVLVCLAVSLSAQANWHKESWLAVEGIFTDFRYKEPSLMKETGRLTGIRGEMGVNLFGTFALSLGGSYVSGHLKYDGSTFSGTPIKQITVDYLSDLRALAHIVSEGFVISGGFARREWFNDLVISYRRRTTYTYMPVQLTVFHSLFYLTIEKDFWVGGENKSYMSDVSSSRSDVELKQSKGDGWGAELGVLLPSPMVRSKLFVFVHEWRVKASSTQSDGVDVLQEPKNQTQMLGLGFGLVF